MFNDSSSLERHSYAGVKSGGLIDEGYCARVTPDTHMEGGQSMEHSVWSTVGQFNLVAYVRIASALSPRTRTEESISHPLAVGLQYRQRVPARGQ